MIVGVIVVNSGLLVAINQRARAAIGVPATPNADTLSSPSPPARTKLNYLSDTLFLHPIFPPHHRPQEQNSIIFLTPY
jgi:hypothetical protein